MVKECAVTLIDLSHSQVKINPILLVMPTEPFDGGKGMTIMASSLRFKILQPWKEYYVVVQDYATSLR